MLQRHHLSNVLELAAKLRIEPDHMDVYLSTVDEMPKYLRGLR